MGTREHDHPHPRVVNSECTQGRNAQGRDRAAGNGQLKYYQKGINGEIGPQPDRLGREVR